MTRLADRVGRAARQVVRRNALKPLALRAGVRQAAQQPRERTGAVVAARAQAAATQPLHGRLHALQHHHRRAEAAWNFSNGLSLVTGLLARHAIPPQHITANTQTFPLTEHSSDIMRVHSLLRCAQPGPPQARPPNPLPFPAAVAPGPG